MPIPQFTAGQVLTAAQLNAMVDAINAGGAVKVDRFTASGTWTVPTGVTYAVAYITAGGGGTALGTTPGGQGGTSSVAFAGGTVSATGGLGTGTSSFATSAVSEAGPANSGYGANIRAGSSAVEGANRAQNGALITAGGAVTAGASITVTVGAGGTAGASGAAGGSGYVYIEYQGS